MKATTWLYVGAVILLLLAQLVFALGVFCFWERRRSAGSKRTWEWRDSLGAIALIGGIVMIFIAARKNKQEATQNVTYQVDLPGETKIAEMKCRFLRWRA